MQRALGVSNPSGAVINKSQELAKDVSSTAEPEKKVRLTPGTPQKQPTAGTINLTLASTAANKPDDLKNNIAPPVKMTPRDPQNIPHVGTSPGQTCQAERKASNAAESGGFLGFGGSKTQPDTSKPAESVTGKMFGLGSSIFNSASSLINSTPPVSPKMSPMKQSQDPSVPKKEEKLKWDQSQMTKRISSEQTKEDTSQKVAQSTCPLCKVELNVGSQDLPNYDTCTNCKITVCKQCGFNPIPNVLEVSKNCM